MYTVTEAESEARGLRCGRKLQAPGDGIKGYVISWVLWVWPQVEKVGALEVWEIPGQRAGLTVGVESVMA